VRGTISDHIRSNVIGYIALFCFAIGGTAYASHPGGANTISSADIINGEVKSGDLGDAEVKGADVAPDSLGGAKIADRSVKNADLGLGASASNTIADGGVQGVDVKNDDLTGADVAPDSLTGAEIDEDTLVGGPTNPTGPAGGDLDGTYPNPEIAAGAVGSPEVDEASLSFECPAGYTLASKDVCFDGEHAAASHATALGTCTGSGDRLPSMPEAMLVVSALPAGFVRTWTDELTNGTAQAVNVVKSAAGAINRVESLASSTLPYRCVTSPHG
jgi:hypothetical protein